MSSIGAVKQSKPWYYYPWVWFIIALLSSAVIASFITLKIAVDRPNDILPVTVTKFALDQSSANAHEDVETSPDNRAGKEAVSP